MPFKVPDGFLPVLNYPDGKEPGIMVAGECKLGKLQFFIGHPVKKVPALPLKKIGELWHKGWDIPTRWAIDANGQCWMDSAHGGSLVPASQNALLSNAETEEDKNLIRRLLELSPEEPGWMKQARAAGWIPPDKKQVRQPAIRERSKP